MCDLWTIVQSNFGGKCDLGGKMVKCKYGAPNGSICNQLQFCSNFVIEGSDWSSRSNCCSNFAAKLGENRRAIEVLGFAFVWCMPIFSVDLFQFREHGFWLVQTFQFLYQCCSPFVRPSIVARRAVTPSDWSRTLRTRVHRTEIGTNFEHYREHAWHARVCWRAAIPSDWNGRPRTLVEIGTKLEHYREHWSASS